jgi:hypothetical protein
LQVIDLTGNMLSGSLPSANVTMSSLRIIGALVSII